MIVILLSVAAVFGIGLILNANLLFPWQYQARYNKDAIMKYVRANYPGAKTVEEYYPTMQFNPTGRPYDVIWFELNDVEFYIEARDGKVDYDNDGYGFSLLRNEIRNNYLNDFFSQRGLPYDIEIGFSDYSSYWPKKGAKISEFPGIIKLDILLEYEEEKQTPRDLGWFYDSFCYWKEVCPTKDFSIRFCCYTEEGDTYQLHCYSTSEFNSKDEFYNLFKIIEH